MGLIDRFIVASVLWAFVALALAISDAFGVRAIDQLLVRSGLWLAPALTAVFLIVAPYLVKAAHFQAGSSASLAKLSSRSVFFFAAGALTIVLLVFAALFVPGFSK
jgi:hypothetical protein